MRSELEKRLSRLETRVAKRKEDTKVCSCRISTRFHNAACLDVLLKRIPRVCPIHGFRELGTLWFTPSWCLLRREDNQYCPCPPHPWRSFVLNGPRTWEAQDAAREAWEKFQPGDELSFEEENRRLDVVMKQYWAGRQQWYVKTGRQPPTRREILKLGRDGVPTYRSG